MLKAVFIAGAIVIAIASVGLWDKSHAMRPSATGDMLSVYDLQVQVGSKNLPVQEIQDYSVVFPFAPDKSTH